MYTDIYRCTSLFLCVNDLKVYGIHSITSISFLAVKSWWLRSSEYESSKFQCLFIFRYITKSQMLFQILADICKSWISHPNLCDLSFWVAIRFNKFSFRNPRRQCCQETSKGPTYPFSLDAQVCRSDGESHCRLYGALMQVRNRCLFGPSQPLREQYAEWHRARFLLSLVHWDTVSCAVTWTMFCSLLGIAPSGKASILIAALVTQ